MIRRGAKLHAYVDEWMDDKTVDDQKLAGRLDVTPSAITKWRAKGWNIELDRIEQIANALDIDPTDQIFSLPGKDPLDKYREQIEEEIREKLRAVGL